MLIKAYLSGVGACPGGFDWVDAHMVISDLQMFQTLSF